MEQIKIPDVKWPLKWLCLKPLFYGYAALPMVCYMATLYVVAVSRESLGTLTIIMVGMLNPLVAIPIGSLARSFGKKIWKYEDATDNQGYCHCVFRRLFTFSFNIYLFLIACSVMYVFEMSLMYRNRHTTATSSVKAKHDFKNLKFDQCFCKDEKNDGHYCVNNDKNFQNYLVILQNSIFIYSFIVCHLVFHIIHSLITKLPHPLPMLDFIMGHKEVQKDQLHEDINQPQEHELQPMNLDHSNETYNRGSFHENMILNSNK